jgi:hypothetical protein
MYMGLVTTAEIGHGRLAPDDLRRVANHARLVVLSAYDGEGELFFASR